MPIAFVKDSVVQGGTYAKFKIEPARKYFINVGSVGQSRDVVSKATYVIYDVVERTVKLRRLDYDIERTREKLKKLGFGSNKPPDHP